jgi:hypothetical protein
MEMDIYTARASGSTGQEILNPDGEIVAWTVDGWWAAIIVGLLNQSGLNSESLTAQLQSPPRFH